MSSIILINPWIYDFATYDLWSKPLGLLYIAGLLRDQGFSVSLIDCMDVHHPRMNQAPSLTKPVRRAYGTGKYFREPIKKPPALENIKRTYSRYGITTEIFRDELKKIKNPRAILVTSLMTYWYPGVTEVIKITREVHPDVPVILGGIYARLCGEHAKRISGADYVADDITMESPDSFIETMDRFGIPAVDFEMRSIRPAFDMLNCLEYVCITTSMGCPYKCEYCASSILNPAYYRRDPEAVVEEIMYWHKTHNVRDFAFYDDALLIDHEKHICLILEKIMSKGLNLRFHTPNALHLNQINPDVARLLYKSGFKTIRLGLETSDMDLHNRIDKKVGTGDFERAIENLLRTGFKKHELGAYILMGLPGQSVESVARTIEFSDEVGAMPYLAEYSPLPGTALWKDACIVSEYDLKNEPLYQNNSLLPCWDEDKRERVPELRKMVKRIREKAN